MTQETLRVLSSRLDRLERENRLLKWVLSGTGALVIGFACSNFGSTSSSSGSQDGTFDVVRARMFQLEDSNGEVRGAFAMDDWSDKKVPALKLFREDGTDVVGLWGSTLGLLTVGPSDGMHVAASAHMITLDAGETTQLRLSNVPGDSGLSVFDQNGKERIHMGLGLDDAPSLTISDSSENTRAELYLLPDGTPSLVLSDSNRTRAVLGRVSIQTIATGATEDTPESSLVLFDRNGRVVRQLP